MRLNRYCTNCGLMKDASYENLCEACSAITVKVITDPSNLNLPVPALHTKVREALSLARVDLGIQSKPDSRTIIERSHEPEWRGRLGG